MRRHAALAGYTLIELLVVLVIVALLLAVAAPRYFSSIEVGKEGVLRENLYSLRDSLDKYYADNGVYPTALADLVTKHYLRQIPIDPITGSSSSWKLIPPTNTAMGGVFDVQSTAPGQALDGSYFQSW